MWGPSWLAVFISHTHELTEGRAPVAPLVLPFTLLVVLASFTSGDQHLCEIVTLCRPPPHQDWGRARIAGSRFVRDDKELES
jgi:hypothetical protein